MITMKEIANLCGVSMATVSKSLHRRPGINADTSKRVREIARKYGYQTNALVRGIQTGQTMIVGVPCDSMLSDAFESAILMGIQAHLSSRGYDILIIPWDSRREGDVRPLQQFAERRVDGMILPPLEVRPSLLEALRQIHFPVVVFDRVWPGCEYDCIGSENRSGMVSVTEHVIGLGHRRIAFLGNASVPTSQMRLEGFKEAALRSGVPVRKEWILDVSSGEPIDQARDLLQSGDRPSAFLCFNDRMAWDVLGAAYDLGIQVPDELSVTGFADLPLASKVRPRLTTVAQHPVEIGRAAAKRLVERINERRKGEGEKAPPEELLLPTRLVVRDSTAPPIEARP